MDERPNVFEDTFTIARGGMRAEQVLARAGAQELGGTLYELSPGHDGLPLHVHHALEEAAIVIAGTPTLRTLEGESQLSPGDVVVFPRGRRGGHTLCNRSSEAVRYLMLSTKAVPEVVEYPEDGTVRVVTRMPFSLPEPGEDPADRINLLFKREDAT